MKRHIPGLHARQLDGERPLEGLFLARVEWASYRWPIDHSSPSGSSFSNLNHSNDGRSPGGCTPPKGRCGN